MLRTKKDRSYTFKSRLGRSADIPNSQTDSAHIHTQKRTHLRTSCRVYRNLGKSQKYLVSPLVCLNRESISTCRSFFIYLFIVSVLHLALYLMLVIFNF